MKSGRRKKHIPTIVHVWPLFTGIPNKDSNAFVDFCWSELLLYKPFHSLSKDIDLSKEDILANWESIRNGYHAWHVNRIPIITPDDQQYEGEPTNINIQSYMEMNELQYLSTLIPARTIQFGSFDMLGLRGINTSHPWDQPEVFEDTFDDAPNFVNYIRRKGKFIHEHDPLCPFRNTLSTNQQHALYIVIQHSQASKPKETLKMIIQGTAGTEKSYLISRIKEALSYRTKNGQCPILFLPLLVLQH